MTIRIFDALLCGGLLVLAPAMTPAVAQQSMSQIGTGKPSQRPLPPAIQKTDKVKPPAKTKSTTGERRHFLDATGVIRFRTKTRSCEPACGAIE